MIEVNGLTKRYGAKTAVDNLSFTVRPGHVTGFLGPNGAGKTTTMRVILGLDAPTAGTTTVGGVPFRSHRRGLRHAGALHAIVFTAWQRLTQAYGPPRIADSRAQAGQLLPGLYPPLGEAWISYAAWPLVALVLALIVVRRRDV